MQATPTRRQAILILGCGAVASVQAQTGKPGTRITRKWISK